MPNFTLNRDYVLATTRGHIINFVKGVPAWVPHECVQQAVSIGAECEEEVDVIGDAPVPVVQPEGPARDEAFTTAFELLVARNNRDDFTGTGVPAVKAVQELLGFKPDKAELNTRWTAFAAK